MSYWKEIVVEKISPVRFLMHRALEKYAEIVPPCVDIGGGEQTYLKHLKNVPQDKILLVDIVPEADVNCNLETNLPFLDGQFKSVLMLNVLELIFNYQNLCSEIRRIIDGGGKAYIWVPFLINVHPHPADYFRYTDVALQKIFIRAGFSHIEVRAYGGLGVTIGTFLGQLFAKLKIVTPFIHILSFQADKLLDTAMGHEKNVKIPIRLFSYSYSIKLL